MSQLSDIVRRGWPRTTRPTGRKHKLKCRQPFFRDIVEGRKTFELRLNDRGYNAGDVLTLLEVEPPDAPGGNRLLTGEQVDVIVTYVTSGPPWLSNGYVCMSIALFEDND